MTLLSSRDALTKFSQQRDPDAFAAIVTTHVDLVYAAACRQVGRAAADDVAQQVFLILARKAHTINPELLCGWLILTTRYCSADLLRHRKRQQHHEREAATMRHETRQDEAADHDLLQVMDEAMTKLSAQDRTAVALRYLQQQSLAEMGQTLGITEEAAKKRVSRAMEKLRARLAPLRRAITVTTLAVALEKAATVTAPPTLAATIGQTVPAAPLATALSGALAKVPAVCMFLVAAVSVSMWILSGRFTASAPLAIPANYGSETTPTKRLPTPTLASLSPQQRRIYELIYSFRDSIASNRSEEWIPAVRELTEIGAPAVPALCVELEKSQGDPNQRLLLMTLRLIKDPRSVPAILDVIPRLHVETSDFGFTVEDSGLRAWINERNALRPINGQSSEFNRSMTEAVAALEAITGHSEGKQIAREFPSDGRSQKEVLADLNNRTIPTTQETIDREKVLEKSREENVAHRKAYADRWRLWWDAHEAGFAPDMDSIDAARFAGDLVESVGAASAAPLFPAGPGVELSAVHQMDLPVAGLWDRSGYFNIATGQALSEGEGATSEMQDEKWRRTCGVDLITTTRNTSYSHRLIVDGDQLRIWPVDNNRFDHIDEEIKLGVRIDRGNGGVYGYMPIPYDSTYPQTYLVETRGHQCAILQVMGETADHTRLRMRYRLWPANTKLGIPATQPIREELSDSWMNAKFGNVHRVILYAPASGKPAAINLVTGKTLPQEVDVDNAWFTDAKKAWARSNEMQLMTRWQRKLVSELAGPEVRAAHVSDAAWDSMSAELAARIAQRAQRMPLDSQPSIYFDMGNREPEDISRTYVIILGKEIKTVALIQMIEMNGEQITFQYKLVVPRAH